MAGRPIAVLGGGLIGRRHLQNLQGLGVSDLLLFEPNEGRRWSAEADLAVATAATMDAVWNRPPWAVIVAAPTHRHTALALEAARRGCHLFVEKPLAHTLEGLEPLCRESARRGLVTMVGCNMRFHPGPAQVKALLAAGEIGEPLAARVETGSYLPRWRPAQDYRDSYSASSAHGGAVLDCIHEIDLSLWYLGPAALAGAAVLPARTLGLETDGLAEILLRHDGGAVSSVHLNFVQRDYRRACRIVGGLGTLYWDWGMKRVDVFGPDGARARSIPEPDGWQVNDMYRDEMAYFLQAAAGVRPAVNPLAEAQETLRLALEVRAWGAGRREAARP